MNAGCTVMFQAFGGSRMVSWYVSLNQSTLSVQQWQEKKYVNPSELIAFLH